MSERYAYAARTARRFEWELVARAGGNGRPRVLARTFESDFKPEEAMRHLLWRAAYDGR